MGVTWAHVISNISSVPLWTSGVVASCKHREGKLAAGRVRKMVVVPFPRAFVDIKAEASCEEQHCRP